MSLKELRMKRGLTQRELAQRSGVHHVEIAQIETGKRNVRAVYLILHCDCAMLSRSLIRANCLILIQSLRRIDPPQG